MKGNSLAAVPHTTNCGNRSPHGQRGYSENQPDTGYGQQGKTGYAIHVIKPDREKRRRQGSKWNGRLGYIIERANWEEEKGSNLLARELQNVAEHMEEDLVYGSIQTFIEAFAGK